MVSGHFDKRQFDKKYNLGKNLTISTIFKYFWRRTIRRVLICWKDNLARWIWRKVRFNKYLEQKVQFSEIFLYDFNYFVKFSFVKKLRQIVIFVQFFPQNCILSNLSHQIVLFIKFVRRKIWIRQIVPRQIIFHQNRRKSLIQIDKISYFAL